REPRERARPGGGGEGTGSGAASSVEARERAERLAEAGDRAIRAALSQDSARFLSQNQQEGGQ
ncbi:MAG: hypothetical protein JRE71_19070, partial [Deltaproteobacteria bacterium]|nr:hypothetical protein [Deltaproteobacteria bacterium]